MERPTTLYIIGNGFDLHHGLPTSYRQFQHWLMSVDSSFLLEIEKLCPAKDILGDSLLWSNFEEALGKFDKEQLLNHGFEDAYVLFVDNEPVCSILELHFLRKLGKLFADWAREISYEGCHSDIDLASDARFITFNYTDTLEEVYRIPTKSICHINGRAKTDEQVIIGHSRMLTLDDFGQLSDYTSEFNRQVENITDIQALYKDYEHQWSATIKKDFISDLSSIQQVIVLGHSYSDVDLNYFKMIKSNVSSEAQWNMTYHRDADLKNRANYCHQLGLQESGDRF